MITPQTLEIIPNLTWVVLKPGTKLNEQGSNYKKFELILEGRMNKKLNIFHRIKENTKKNLLRDSVENSKL